ncbi:MAG: hypothetical protein QX189_02295 [Methylococcales bacterium]
MNWIYLCLTGYLESQRLEHSKLFCAALLLQLLRSSPVLLLQTDNSLFLALLHSLIHCCRPESSPAKVGSETKKKIEANINLVIMFSLFWRRW